MERESRGSGSPVQGKRLRARVLAFRFRYDRVVTEQHQQSLRGLEVSYKRRCAKYLRSAGVSTLQRAAPLSLGRHGQASDCERQSYGMRLTGLAEVVAGDHRDPPEPVAHGVEVNKQDPRRGLEPAASVKIGRGRLEQGFVGGAQRTIDPVDHGSAGGGVTGQNTLHQQFVGENGPGRIRPGASGDQAREGGSGRASSREQGWHRRADDDGAVAEVLSQCLNLGGRILQAPEDDNQTLSLNCGQRLDLEAGSCSPYEVNDLSGIARRAHSGGYRDVADRSPAQGGGS